jgi:cytochrome b
MANLTSTETTVWDPAVRLFHWTLVTAFFVGWISGDEWQDLHVYAGYLVGLLLAFRIVWGFVGPMYARFTNFVRRPYEVHRYLADAIRLRAPRYLGHNPAGGAMVVALLGALTLTVISGLGLYAAADFGGPLAGLVRGEFAADVLEEVHELGANSVLLLVALHLAGVLFSSLEHGENLVRSMITGRKKAST